LLLDKVVTGVKANFEPAYAGFCSHQQHSCTLQVLVLCFAYFPHAHHYVTLTQFIDLAMESRGANPPTEIDFAVLTAQGIWSIFVSKSCYGGALAYAMLSRANKMGCLCSVSLEKLPANRMKQKECWYDWCSLACNLFWARRVSFQLVSQRASYNKKIFASWSEPEALPLPALSCCEFTIPACCVARIASLAVQVDSSKLLDQIVLCANDDRRLIIQDLWMKIKKDFVCNPLWEPHFEFKFCEVRHIRPTFHPNDDLSPGTIADTWLRILYHLRLSLIHI
jgi:hypothetical protein